jgi:hypothetical protein
MYKEQKILTVLKIGKAKAKALVDFMHCEGLVPTSTKVPCTLHPLKEKNTAPHIEEEWKRPAVMAHNCNPSYSEGKDREDL